MRITITLGILFLHLTSFAQNASITGLLQDAEGETVSFANVALYNASDTTLQKVEATNAEGRFLLPGLIEGTYLIKITYVGVEDLWKTDIQLNTDQELDLGVLSFAPSAVELTEATVTARRALVEVKPDRTVFNVEGTINSTGSDAISLLRKAPSVTVDNNNNINVLGRSGVLLYIDGKRLPLTGEDLTNYLETLRADQIDRIDIITNPGAKYEAEGNAGIIDIRLKKDKNLGANGSVNTTFSQGVYAQSNIGGNGNYRNKKFNTFVQFGAGDNTSFFDMKFQNFQNGLFLDETNDSKFNNRNYNYRVGTDFFLSENHTIGFLVSGREVDGENVSLNRIAIAQMDTPENIDSILVGTNDGTSNRKQNTYNINYRFANKEGRTINIDLDYGRYQNENQRFQPNLYYDPTETTLLTSVINSFDTPTDIDIYTFKVDFEENLWGGRIGLGSKISSVISDNTFLFFDVIENENILNNTFSNKFRYEENVYAGYISYSRQLGKKVSFSAGLRAEQTDAMGDLTPFLEELQEDPVDLNYLSWFPSAGLTWQAAPQHSFAINYGRRINRPDYNVLNPFNNRLSELSFEKGNPFLRPEIVNNYEVGYTYAYRYNFKLAYSKTTDQITRLIGPDENDPRAGFITWENLSEQEVWSFNLSAPVQVNKIWNAYTNFSASHINNQADYGEGAVVDVQAFTFNVYQQHTITLPKGFTGEISGWFAGPGVWGGVFEYESQWSLNLGLQKKFFRDKLNVRVTVNDIFYESGFDGFSEFNGLFSEGSGRWDSRRGAINLTYNFGNQNVKSRKRKTGLEEEAKRTGGGGNNRND